jgi:hypothetical protein
MSIAEMQSNRSKKINTGNNRCINKAKVMISRDSGPPMCYRSALLSSTTFPTHLFKTPSNISSHPSSFRATTFASKTMGNSAEGKRCNVGEFSGVLLLDPEPAPG